VCEHLIIDGGSTDRTVEIIKKYSANYPHIRWLSERDRGQSDALNKGIGLAKGEIIGILNVDDYYEAGVLNRICEISKTLPIPSLIVGNCMLWNDDGELTWVNRPSIRLSDFLEGKPFPVNPSAYFYHRSLHELIGPYNIEEDFAMDVDFLCKAVEVAHVSYFDENWGNFRFIKGTKTYEDTQKGRNISRQRKIFSQYRKQFPLHKIIIISIFFETRAIRARLRQYIFRQMEIFR
jgi:glycosyltransferase involved in cell wall biosynthesis